MKMNTHQEAPGASILRVAIMAVVGLLLFVPLIVGQEMYFPFIVGKGLYIRSLVQIVAALYLVLIAIDPSSRPRRTPLLWSLGVFVIITSLATIFSASPLRSFWSNFERMEGLILMLHLAVLFVIASSVIRKREWVWFAGFSLAISLIVGTIALGDIGKAVAQAQAAGTASNVDAIKASVRISGTLGNSTYLGVYALIHVFLSGLFMLMIYRGNREVELLESGTTHKRARPLTIHSYLAIILVGAVLVFNLFVLYKTGTRGSFVGLVGGVMVTSAYLAWKERSRLLRWGAIGVFTAMVLCVALLGIFKHSTWVESKPQLSRYAALISFDIKGVLSRLGEDRTMVWGMAAEGAKEKPLLGWGPDNFGYVFAKHYNPGMYAREQWFDRSHNVFMDWLVAAGFLGLLSYLAFFVIAAWLLISKRSRMTVVERATLLGLLVAYFIHNLFVFDNLTSYVMFFLILAYIHDRYAHDRAPIPPKPGKDYGTIIIGTSFVAILALGFTLQQTVFQPMKQNHLLAQVVALANQQNQVTPQIATKIRVQPMDTAYDNFVNIYKLGNPTSEVFEQLSNLFPAALASAVLPQASKEKIFALYQSRLAYHTAHNEGDPRYAFFTASFYQRIGMTDEALKYAKLAQSLSPKKQTFAYMVAQLFIQKNDFASALPYLKNAYESWPQNPEAFAYYSATLFETAKDQKTKVLDTLKLGGLAEVLADGYQKYGHTLLVEDRLWNMLDSAKQPVAAKLFAKRLGELVPEKKTEFERLAK